MAWLLAACLLASIAARPARADDSPNWVIGAHHSLFVGDGSVVYGDIAAEADVSAPYCADSSEVTLGTGVVVHGSVWGDAVSVRGTPADAGTVHYATSLTPAASSFPSGATADDLALPIELFGMCVPGYPTDTPLAAVTVTAGTEADVDEGVYVSLTIEAGTETTPTVVRLTGEYYAFGSITIGTHARLEFASESMVLVETRLLAADHVAIGASWGDGVAAQNTGIVVLGGNGSGAGGLADDPKAASLGDFATQGNRGVRRQHVNFSLGRAGQAFSLESSWARRGEKRWNDDLSASGRSLLPPAVGLAGDVIRVSSRDGCDEPRDLSAEMSRRLAPAPPTSCGLPVVGGIRYHGPRPQGPVPSAATGSVSLSFRRESSD